MVRNEFYFSYKNFIFPNCENKELTVLFISRQKKVAKNDCLDKAKSRKRKQSGILQIPYLYCHLTHFYVLQLKITENSVSGEIANIDY